MAELLQGRSVTFSSSTIESYIHPDILYSIVVTNIQARSSPEICISLTCLELTKFQKRCVGCVIHVLVDTDVQTPSVLCLSVSASRINSAMSSSSKQCTYFFKRLISFYLLKQELHAHFSHSSNYVNALSLVLSGYTETWDSCVKQCSSTVEYAHVWC